MNPNQSLKKLRIFAASPSDVANERAKLETVVGLLKPLADHIGVSVEVVDWRKVVPDMGRPQQVIFDQLQPTTWDVFVGILWHRFGTPPGGKDPQTQKEYLSGTEEEFETASRLSVQFGTPRVMLYRCVRQVDLDTLDPDQFKRVKEFFAQFEIGNGKCPGVYQTFDTIEAFEKLLLNNLQKLLLEYSEREQGQTVSEQTMAVIAPQQNPDTLPRRTAFFGRDHEMTRVLHALSPNERGWGVVIDGIGGIGKTALAVEAAYRCKEAGLFKAFIFVSAKQKRLEPRGIKEQSSVAATLDEFSNETARVLGQIGIAKLTGEDKRRALLEALRSKRALLIYDNLETLSKEEQEALADFLRFLPQGCKAILTSRRRGGEGALWLRLEKLDWETACKIIVHETERDEHLQAKLQRVRARWQELYDATGGSPLALIHILGLMRVRVTLTFEAALTMLQQGVAGESDLQKFIYEEARKELSPSDIAVLNALSSFVPSASFEALMAVADLTRTVLETVLERLNALALVDILSGEERYSLHPLTRAYVRDELLADTVVSRVNGILFAHYWVDYAERYGGSSKNYATFNSLEAEWLNLEAAANWLLETANVKDARVGDKDAAQWLINLADALSQFLWFSGRWDERVYLASWGYEAAQGLRDWYNAGRHAYRVAWIHYYRGRTDDAILWTARCAAAWEHAPSRLNQSIAVHMRGLIARQRQNYDEAERCFQEALTIFRDIRRHRDVAIVLNDLGKLARKRKDYDAAEKYYREALELAQKIDDKEEQTINSNNLSKLAIDRQQWAEARQGFEQALPLAREVGRVDLIAQAQHGLAQVWEAENRPDLALPPAQEALAIYERLQYRDLAVTRELVQRLTAAVQKGEN